MKAIAPINRIVWIAVCFEIGLGLIAILFGWLFGTAPLQNCRWDLAALRNGLLATLPPALLFLAAEKIPWRPVRQLSTLVHDLVGKIFVGCGLAELALVSVAAGIGEELLFRGLIQAMLTDSLGIVAAIALASLIFGAVHWLSAAYFILATAMGTYLGWLFWETGNLAVPIIVHAVYDLLALAWVCRVAPRGGTS